MLQDVIERMMKVLSHEDQMLLSDSYLEKLVNEAQRVLALHTNQTKTSKSSLAAEAHEVTFPADLLRLVTVYWGDDANKSELKPAIGYLPGDSLYEEDDHSGEGDPYYYYVTGNKVLLRPIPNVAGHAYLEYIPAPTALVKLDDPLAWADSQYFLFVHSVYQFYTDYGEGYERTAEKWKAIAEEALSDWVNNSYNQNYSQPLVLKQRW